MKKTLVTIMVLLLALSLVACATAPAPAAQQAPAAADSKNEAPAKENIKIAGIVFQETQFMQLIQNGYRDAAKENGVECMLGNSNNDQAKETQLINTYVTQKIDGIAIAPLSEETSIETLKQANGKGVKIALTNLTLGVGDDFAVCSFTSDNYELGKLTGQSAKKFIEEKLGGKAKIGIIQFKSLIPQISADRTNGFLDQLKDLPGVEVVADQDSWVQDKAVQVVGDMITANVAKGGIDILWSASGSGTIGAAMAVQNAGLEGKTYVFGTDAEPQILTMLKDDTNIIQAITGQDPYQMGYKAAEHLIKHIKGEITENEKGVTVDCLLLERSNPEAIDQCASDIDKHSR